MSSPSDKNIWQKLAFDLAAKNTKSLARTISLIENEVAGYEELLTNLPVASTPVIGITGAPGAGKSTLVNALIEQITLQNKTIGILCIDPSSPFNFGALLGDRIRMNQWYNNPNVYIRSLAARGSLGGLHPNIIEITEAMKSFGFDYVIVETVGVGQSEVEIAGLADITVVVLSPEGGDDIQTMKAGIMEIADIFVVNKADRPQANEFANSLKSMVAHSSVKRETPVIKTIASKNEGISELLHEIIKLQGSNHHQLQPILLAQRAFQLIQKHRMSNIDKAILAEKINNQLNKGQFNLFAFVQEFSR